MSRVSFGLLLVITLMAGACGYGSRNYMNGNGMPQITQFAPPNATVGEGPFVLTVNGTGFGTDSVVYWGATTRTTMYVNTTQVKANITALDTMNAGMVQVYVHSGGANSNAVSYTIQ